MHSSRCETTPSRPPLRLHANPRFRRKGQPGMHFGVRRFVKEPKTPALRNDGQQNDTFHPRECLSHASSRSPSKRKIRESWATAVPLYIPAVGLEPFGVRKVGPVPMRNPGADHNDRASAHAEAAGFVIFDGNTGDQPCRRIQPHRFGEHHPCERRSGTCAAVGRPPQGRYRSRRAGALHQRRDGPADTTPCPALAWFHGSRGAASPHLREPGCPDIRSAFPRPAPHEQCDDISMLLPSRRLRSLRSGRHDPLRPGGSDRRPWVSGKVRRGPRMQYGNLEKTRQFSSASRFRRRPLRHRRRTVSVPKSPE